jgi:hypothetical protein
MSSALRTDDAFGKVQPRATTPVSMDDSAPILHSSSVFSKESVVPSMAVTFDEFKRRDIHFSRQYEALVHLSQVDASQQLFLPSSKSLPKGTGTGQLLSKTVLSPDGTNFTFADFGTSKSWRSFVDNKSASLGTKKGNAFSRARGTFEYPFLSSILMSICRSIV